jgi:hypothetical protein
MLLRTLRSGCYDSVHLERYCRVCQQSAIDRCVSLHGDHRLGQYGSREVRVCSNADGGGGLPEHILGLCTARQDHILRGGLVKSSGSLEDPYAVRATRERDVVDIATLPVHLQRPRAGGSPPISPAPKLRASGNVRPAPAAVSMSPTAVVRPVGPVTLQGLRTSSKSTV